MSAPHHDHDHADLPPPTVEEVADGVYAYTATSSFPTNSFNATNYWVDVDFDAVALTPPGAASGVSASAGPGSANVSWTAPTTGGAVTKYVITPFVGSENNSLSNSGTV